MTERTLSSRLRKRILDFRQELGWTRSRPIKKALGSSKPERALSADSASLRVIMNREPTTADRPTSSAAGAADPYAGKPTLDEIVYDRRHDDISNDLTHSMPMMIDSFVTTLSKTELSFLIQRQAKLIVDTALEKKTRGLLRNLFKVTI